MNYYTLFVVVCVLSLHENVDAQSATGTPISVKDKLSIATAYAVPRKADGTPYNPPANLSVFPTSFDDPLNWLENMLIAFPGCADVTRDTKYNVQALNAWNYLDCTCKTHNDTNVQAFEADGWFCPLLSRRDFLEGERSSANTDGFTGKVMRNTCTWNYV